MSTKISELAEKLEIPAKELKEKITELGFEVAPRARVIDDELAELLIEELSSATDEVVPDAPADDDIVEIYDEMIAQEREREIVKSQRKKTAGRVSKKKGASESKPTNEIIDGEVDSWSYYGKRILWEDWSERRQNYWWINEERYFS